MAPAYCSMSWVTSGQIKTLMKCLPRPYTKAATVRPWKTSSLPPTSGKSCAPRSETGGEKAIFPSNQGLTVCWSVEVTSVKWPGWSARMCASTSSAAAASAPEAEGSAPPRFLCSNFQEAPATSKSTAARPPSNAAEKPNRTIHPRFVWVESVVDLATEKGNTPCEKEKSYPSPPTSFRITDPEYCNDNTPQGNKWVRELERQHRFNAKVGGWPEPPAAGFLDLVDLVAQTAEVRSRDPGGSTGPQKPGLGREEPSPPRRANYRMRFSHTLSADCHGQRRERRVAPRATFGGWRI